MKILFMCVANSARSQIAEGLAKDFFKNKAWIESAGSKPQSVNPYAIRVLKEQGIDITQNQSKSIDQLSPEFVNDLDYIITLCHEEVCPSFFSKTAKRIHWPFQDPAKEQSDQIHSDELQLNRFRATMKAISHQIRNFATEIGL